MAGATPAAWNSAPAKRWRSALEITCTSSFDGIPAARSNFGEGGRSEEHTSELQSQFHLVCRLLLEKKTAFASDGWPFVIRTWRSLLVVSSKPCVENRFFIFFLKDSATKVIYTLSLHAALPI